MAYSGLPNDEYFPAASCYMGASITATFQPPYKYKPPPVPQATHLLRSLSCSCYDLYKRTNASVITTVSFAPSAIEYHREPPSEETNCRTEQISNERGTLRKRPAHSYRY